MKFSFKPGEILSELKLLASSLGNGQPLPVLANFLITVEQNKATISATDFDTQMCIVVAVQVETSGAITVPGKKLIEICSAVAPDAVLNVSVEDERAVLKSGRSRFVLSTLPANHFADIGEVNHEVNLDLPASALHECIEKVSHAMAKDDVRYYLNGMLFEITQTGVRCVGTDGHRLAMQALEAEINIEDAYQVIIPRKSVGLLSKVMQHANKINVSIGKTLIVIKAGDTCLKSKLIDAQFPQYGNVIPKTNRKVLVDRLGLITALQRARIVTSKKFKASRFVLTDNLFRIETTNDKNEESHEELTIKFNGTLELGLNVDYLMDALSGCTTEEARLALSEQNRGIVVQNSDLKESTYRCVIMPTRL